MFKKNTVFVLGAAVSAEVGMPLGWDLKGKISDMLPRPDGGGDDDVRYELLSGGGPDLIARRMNACREIRRALPKAASIDNLVEHRGADKHFKLSAKVGIIAAILHGERRSKLHLPRQKEGAGLLNFEDCTYADLFRLIVGNASTSQLAEAISRVSFVNFNYDRCLEHYLYDWLIGYSGLRPSDAAELVEGLKVVRPYGTVGPLPALHAGAGVGVHFGAELGGLPLVSLAENILTFSEERDSGIDSVVQDVIASAHQLIFLGCAFHPQNMRLLTPAKASFLYSWGTCYVPAPLDPTGRSSPSLAEQCGPTREAFKGTLERWIRHHHAAALLETQFEPLTCRQLVAKYSPRWIDG